MIRLLALTLLYVVPGLADPAQPRGQEATTASAPPKGHDSAAHSVSAVLTDPAHEPPQRQRRRLDDDDPDDDTDDDPIPSGDVPPIKRAHIYGTTCVGVDNFPTSLSFLLTCQKNRNVNS